MKTRLLILFILISTLVLAACSSGGSASDPFAGLKLATLSGDSVQATARPTSAASATGAQTIYENFTSDDGMWALSDDDYGKASFENGAFVVTALQKSQTMWSSYSDNFNDVKIEVDAKALNGTFNNNNGFGVDCRVQENGDGYSFQISSDGYYALVKFADTDGSELVDWTQSDAIAQGEFTNHISVLCQGSTLELWVNNVFLTSITDDEFTSGSISLSATTFSDSPTSVSFDNLEISNP
jgi:hypothetical protein